MNTLGKLSVGVVGTRNHAARLIALLGDSQKVSSLIAFHPEAVSANSEICVTSNINELTECDAIVIASPTTTHFPYIKKFRNYSGYLFVEKPAVSSLKEEVAILEMPNHFKSRLYVNYNFLFSDIYSELKTLVQSSRLGKPVYLSIESCHGLAFKSSYKDSWRSSSSYGVGEVVSVHFLNMVSQLFDIDDFDILKVSGFNNSGIGDAFDTVLVSSDGNLDLGFSVLCSYATPYNFNIKLIGTNAILHYDGVRLCINEPRDTFDSEGRFASPPTVYEKIIHHGEAWRKSLSVSINYFLDKVLNREDFSESHLRRALMAMRPFY